MSRFSCLLAYLFIFLFATFFVCWLFVSSLDSHKATLWLERQ